MLPLAVFLATVAPVFASVGMDLLFIMWITATVIICAAIPLLAGMNKGHVGLGILAALLTIPVSTGSQVFLPGLFKGLGCFGSLLWSVGLQFVIQIIPKFEKPLLSQAEIEAETRRMRGY
jgi:hypothetical protein